MEQLFFPTNQFIELSRSLEGKNIFSLSLLRLDIDFALLHNASITQRKASRLLKENVESPLVTENHLQTHNSS